MSAAGEIDYRPLALLGGWRPGAHGGRGTGGLGRLRETVLFLRDPDPRRIDHRASLRDPFGTIQVRRLEQRTTLTLYLVVDLSASMAHGGRQQRLALVAALYHGLAATARRYGDAIGLIGCGEIFDDRRFFPARRRQGFGDEISTALRQWQPADRHAEALAEVGQRITGRQRLIFLISDFHLPLPVLEDCLRGLAGQDIIPLRLTTAAETSAPPGRGLLRLTDRESGDSRLLWLRPGLRAAWAAEVAARQAALDRLFLTYGRPAITLADDLDPQALGLALSQGGAGP